MGPGPNTGGGPTKGGPPKGPTKGGPPKGDSIGPGPLSTMIGGFFSSSHFRHTGHWPQHGEGPLKKSTWGCCRFSGLPSPSSDSSPSWEIGTNGGGGGIWRTERHWPMALSGAMQGLARVEERRSGPSKQRRRRKRPIRRDDSPLICAWKNLATNRRRSWRRRRGRCQEEEEASGPGSIHLTLHWPLRWRPLLPPSTGQPSPPKFPAFSAR
jgi:hypothetical protein